MVLQSCRFSLKSLPTDFSLPRLTRCENSWQEAGDTDEKTNGDPGPPCVKGPLKHDQRLDFPMVTTTIIRRSILFTPYQSIIHMYYKKRAASLESRYFYYPLIFLKPKVNL
jgi:hypothetical protein